MQEIFLEDPLLIQDPLGALPTQVSFHTIRQNKPRKPKQRLRTKATEGTNNLLENETEYKAMKTPISILQEMLSRRGITPNYELVATKEAVHEPSFCYRVSFNDKDATGAGRSKKEAKHAAAKALIDKLTGLNLSDTFYEQQKQPGEISATSTNTNFDKKNQMENPIGLLQELCKSKNWPPPSYEMEVEVGLPHEREFTIGCLVLKHRKVGVGKTKKIAKRRAAQELWKRLQLQPLDQNQ